MWFHRRMRSCIYRWRLSRPRAKPTKRPCLMRTSGCWMSWPSHGEFTVSNSSFSPKLAGLREFFKRESTCWKSSTDPIPTSRRRDSLSVNFTCSVVFGWQSVLHWWKHLCDVWDRCLSASVLTMINDMQVSHFAKVGSGWKRSTVRSFLSQLVWKCWCSNRLHIRVEVT